MTIQITHRQSNVLAFIRARIERDGQAPTLEEIGEAMGIGHVSAVLKHVRALEAKGRLTIEAGQARGIRLVDEARELLVSGVDLSEQRKMAKLPHEPGPFSSAEAAEASHDRNTRPDGRATSNSLGALGVSEWEEQAYGAILVHHKATAEKVAALLSSTLEETTLLLESLENKGLAIHTPEQPRRYIATPPEFAAEFLTKQRHADLDRARLNMRNMQRLRPNEQEPLEQSVEVISDPTMLNQFIRHLARCAKEEVLVFQRAPVSFNSTNDGKRDDLKVRVVTDATLLDQYGPDFIWQGAEAGEEIRFFRSLPAKLIIVDREIAVIHVSTNSALEETRLIVRRPSGLLDALLVLFELVWDRASPMAPDGTPGVDEEIPEPPKSVDQVITWLSMGLNDKAIAHEAGVSASTITRRIGDLMESFGTRSRFQLGWRAALDAFSDRLDASGKDTSEKGR
ncbi:helix-turn-helix domain-containing protein [Rhodanobacter panaciterrae]|nr:helix-turn-helix domain-containing protein [Rhodanobacter panaciterrae]